jgi:hypothetical protein
MGIRFFYSRMNLAAATESARRNAMTLVTAAPEKTLKFIGKNRFDAKRKALRFWYTHRDTLHESMQDFAKRCTLSPDQKVITYRPHHAGALH